MALGMALVGWLLAADASARGAAELFSRSNDTSEPLATTAPAATPEGTPSSTDPLIAQMQDMGFQLPRREEGPLD